MELAVPAVLAIHLALPHLKAIMAELDTAEGSLTTVAEVAAQVLLAATQLAEGTLLLAVMVRHHP